MIGKVFVSVEEKDFDISEELDKIKNLSGESGAVVLFVGKVRQNNKGKLDFLEIEEEDGRDVLWGLCCSTSNFNCSLIHVWKKSCQTKR